MIINGIDMPDFKRKEFPRGELKHTYPSQLKNMQSYRTILKASINPSKVKGALARLTGSLKSDHRVIISDDITKTKLSSGTDVFCNCNIYKAFTVSLFCGLWNKIGVYFDTHDNDGDFHPMLHLGNNDTRVLWFRSNGKYYTEKSCKRDGIDFYFELQRQFLSIM